MKDRTLYNTSLSVLLFVYIAKPQLMLYIYILNVDIHNEHCVLQQAVFYRKGMAYVF